MDVFRILDRRLQSLRKLGIIQHVKVPGALTMADIIDTAAEIEELQRNAALSAHRID
ncbi:hypothetical protein ID866_9451, partial [Astraeus odoratus]